ncbi:hypothetical protein PVAP13_7NG446200 [Panicum virgatum]|uniref:Uncharacterized protein n=1 Tax=Panicum virgatum TaxID=38727 RepID=A0A8T0QI96_PANVG|nr:hypothetical protein PVAP13_7NG446200 [Panicum virgatum]
MVNVPRLAAVSQNLRAWRHPPTTASSSTGNGNGQETRTPTSSWLPFPSQTLPLSPTHCLPNQNPSRKPLRLLPHPLLSIPRSIHLSPPRPWTPPPPPEGPIASDRTALRRGSRIWERRADGSPDLRILSSFFLCHQLRCFRTSEFSAPGATSKKAPSFCTVQYCELLQHQLQHVSI